MSGENKYMDLLNLTDEAQVYSEIRMLASSLSDQEHIIRSCILDLHAAVEIELRRIFYHTFYAHLYLTGNETDNEKVISDLEKAVEDMSFGNMWRLLKPIMKHWYPDFLSIEDINIVRNKIAHSDISKVIYKNRNPFTCSDCLAQIYFDVWAIKQCIPKYFWKTIDQPKVILKRYIDKYGTGEI